MKKFLILFSIMLNIALWCRPLAAEREIIVRGLTNNKAILSVDGMLLILRKGDPKQNITLLKADNYSVSLIVNGKPKTLWLDKTIAQSYSGPIVKKREQEVKILFEESKYIRLITSRLKKLELVHEDHDTITLKAEYFYSGKQGGNADFVVSIVNKDLLTKNIEEQYHRLEKGNNIVELTFDMKGSKDIVFYTEAVNFVFLGRKEKTVSFYSKTVSLKKYWKRIAIR
jgi:hypothetical protein